MISPAKFLNFTSPPNSGNHRFLHYRKVHFPSPMNAETINSSRPSLFLLGYPRFCCSSLPFRFEGMSSPSIPVARKLVLRPAALAEGDANDGLSSVDVRSNHSGFQDCSPEVSDTSVEKGILQQVKDIVMFAGPALGLWICGPMMSLIDTAVVGQSSSVELAALGPGTVVCDNMSYIFMFLSIATSNMVATALARKDREEAQQHISMLLFVALSCGFGMLFLMKFFGAQILTAFVGVKNSSIIPAANSYVQIRGFAWPAVLVGMVAQSASFHTRGKGSATLATISFVVSSILLAATEYFPKFGAMKDSFGPLKVLIIASIANGFGDLMLCSFWHYGIAGAAWATMASQFVAAFLMIESLSRTGFSVFSLAIPSSSELLQIFELAAPIFVTMLSKIAFYSLITYFATSMGTITLAAHQVMIGVLCMWTVWGEPISQTAQSFMPELIYGVNRNLKKARMLLKSLMIIGICTGCLLGTVGTLVPSLFPYLFTRDPGVVAEMQTVLFPYFVALLITPAIHSLEGSLLAGRDLRFLSFSMSGCFCLGGILLALICSKGYGLPGCWWTLAIFQWARFLLSLQRLLSPQSMLFAEEPVSEKFSKVKAV